MGFSKHSLVKITYYNNYIFEMLYNFCIFANMKKKPSILQKAVNFSKATAKHVMDGSRKVDDKDFSIRMEACLSCDHIIKKDPKTCGLCGCVLKVKARWRTSDCPDNRWEI